MTTYKVWNGSAWVHIDSQNYDARYVLASSKGSNDGVASLDESGHIPSEQLPSSITGAVSYKGTFDPTAGAPLPAAQGYYYVASAVGTVSETSFSTGDWLVYVDESTWNKIENSSSSVTWSNVTDKPASYTPDSHGNESHDVVYITVDGVTYEALDANGDVGTGATQVAAGNHTHTGTYQPLDADLTAIGGLAGTSGLLKKTAANTWTLDTNAYLTEASTVNNALMWDSNEFPSDGLALQVLRLNSDGTVLEFATVTSGSSSFLDLTDTPETYSGSASQYVRVNSSGDALEFATVDALPSQVGNSGKFLTTDGTDASWAALADVGYSSSATTVTLPASPDMGEIFEFVGDGTNWTITANTGQYIRLLSVVSAETGTIASTSGYDCVCLIYIGSNVWLVKSSMGVLEVT